MAAGGRTYSRTVSSRTFSCVTGGEKSRLSLLELALLLVPCDSDPKRGRNAMTRTRLFGRLARARMIRELSMFLLRNLNNPTLGWTRRESTQDRDPHERRPRRD